MKYRILNPNEIEAYNIGYQVGARQIVVADIEWESPIEKKLYRQGYNAGCQDRRRSNVSTGVCGSNVNNVSNISNTKCKKTESNVSNVSNVASSIAIANTDNNILNNNNSSLRNTRVHPTLDAVLEYAKQQNSVAGMGGFACSPELAEQFWMYYESQGWVKGNKSQTPISDWKPLLRRWATDEHNRVATQKIKTAEEPFYL